MDFDESLRYLLSLGHETLAIKLGLDNIENLLDALGRPHESFPSVQIAGTNGKGSTAAMLDAICRAAGIRTGLYTSPHLISVTERVRVGGCDITRERFAEIATAVRAAAERLHVRTGALPTFFEQVTAVALVAFREAGVELAILETGLGGRLDATTVARACVAAITPVALDHQEYLGHTLASIAAEKAAIIRRGVTTSACVAPQTPEVEEVILEVCRQAGVTPRRPTRDIKFEGACDDGRLRFTFRTRRDVYEQVCLSLRGRHQATNAALAVELAETLSEDHGFPVTRASIVAGLERAEHAGRLELRTECTPHLLFDGAHNAAGARALREYLDEFVRAPVTLVFGAMREKDLTEITATLFPAAARVVLTRPDSPRAAAPEEILRALPSSFDSSTITLAPTAAEALKVARGQTSPDGLICVTGSLYLVGEVKSFFSKNF